MKKFLFILLGIVSFIGLIVGAAFYFTAGATEATDKFFQLVKENKLQEAYDSTSKDFQESVSYENFQSFVKDYRLQKIENTFWNSRTVENNLGRIIGTITYNDQSKTRAEIQLIKEKNEWKILHVKLIPEEGNALEVENKIEDSTKPLPSDEETLNLAKKTMASFYQAIEKKDFTEFHSGIAELWKKQITPEELKNIFKDFIGKEKDITAIKDEKPTLSEKPLLDENGMFNVQGYFPNKENNIYFELSYAYEHPEWKLVSIRVSMK